MGTIFTPEIYDILEEEGYDCDSITGEAWDDFDEEFSDECKEFLTESIAQRKPIIVMEWAYKTGVKKKEN